MFSFASEIAPCCRQISTFKCIDSQSCAQYPIAFAGVFANADADPLICKWRMRREAWGGKLQFWVIHGHKSEVLEQTNIFRLGFGWTKPMLEFQEQHQGRHTMKKKASGRITHEGLKKKKKKNITVNQASAASQGGGKRKKRGNFTPTLARLSWPAACSMGGNSLDVTYVLIFMNALIAPLKALLWPGGGYLYKRQRSKNEGGIFCWSRAEKKKSVLTLNATGNNYLAVHSGKQVTWMHRALTPRCQCFAG